MYLFYLLMRKVSLLLYPCIMICSWLPLCKKVQAQCTLAINTFPYSEDFETTDGNWSVNGYMPDWAWGEPAKAVINTAGSGSKCWITGGLTTSFYNNGEASWLQSPCFDLSNIKRPYLKCKLFWETEGKFDGANLQYSLDLGASWFDVGTASFANNCLNNNWYNTSAITYLSPFAASTGGWSGNIQNNAGGCRGGGGSGGWLTADQLIKNLAGQSSVIFRFTFGAGTQCNGFDGFALDDIYIGEAPPNEGSISYFCENDTTAGFAFNTALCPDSYSWNFNDPASGIANFSDLAQPFHAFSAPGVYKVSVIVSNGGEAAFTASQTISILSVTTQIISSITCSGESTGTVKAIVSGGAGNYTYSWNSVPAQFNSSAVNLSAGEYIVNVMAADACAASASATLINPAFSIASSVQQPGCLFEKGTITLNVTGSLPPYSFNWTPNVSNQPVAGNLEPGQYTVAVSNQLCNESLEFIIAPLPKPVLSFRNIQQANCNGIIKGVAEAVVNNGTAPYEFIWKSSPVQTTPAAVDLQPGNVQVTVTDANGCSDTSTVFIGANGICGNIHFANAIAPEGQGNNKLFGPLGNVIELSNYNMAVYNRYGQKVFSSSQPLEKWNGNFKGVRAYSGIYVWYCNYTYKKTIKKNLKGTVMLIR